jgi:hypothetical protein
MMAGAKIVLNMGMDAARDGLADLAGASWMISLPQRQAAWSGHPAGRGRPGVPADGGAGLIVVTFGNMTAPAADRIVLPVGWEPVEPDDEFAVQLDGTITLAPAAAQGCSALTLSGACQVRLAALTGNGCHQVRLEITEAAREFITSVARDIAPDAGAGSLGQSWSW